MPEPLSFAPSKSRLISYAVTTGLLLATSTAIMLTLEQIMHPYLRLTVMIVAFLGCIAFGYAFLYNLMRIWQSQPLFQADAEGLWFHVTFFNHGKVEWADLEGFDIVKYGPTRRVLIQVKRPQHYAEKYPGVRRFLFRRTQKRYGTPLSLPLGLIEGDPVETLKKLSAYGAKLSA
jgi:hypothetical protein